MSLASDYAATEAQTAATLPVPWTGPGGQLTASVAPNGYALLNFQGRKFPTPPAVLLDFAAWVNTTFG